ncbi:MAG: thymidylate synthase [Patiriisocius sp.]|uniref:thymidylate synthase n=1 Tax=Patiriisocius sp. TaxID=2822396 RepID=UPI003EF241D4
MKQNSNSLKTNNFTIECYDSYLVFTLKSKEITTDLAKEILGFADNHYKKRPYVFISNRAFSSNVDPNVYKEINTKVLVGIAIVSEDQEVRKETMREQQLFEGSFSFFKTVEDAIDWAKTVVKS